MKSKAEILEQITVALATGDTDEARATAQREYPFVPVISAGRTYREREKTALFVRDGFVDRYSGERLVFPGALLLLSHLLPEEFPYQANWRADACHIMYWELYPSLDHLVPIARGGSDDVGNWVTTSGFRNGAKGNALLEEIGWTLHPAGDFREWDGLTKWFVDHCSRDAALSRDSSLGKWYRAARDVLSTLQ
jgi:hypothetical protein